MTHIERVKEKAIPIVLFASLGAFAWAIRGQSGFGGMSGCMFAGLLWAAAWYLLSREVSPEKIRRYNLGWCVPAITIGIGIMGMHGWGAWPSWVVGSFNVILDESVTIPITPAWGFLWFFIAGAPWAGMGAVFLAWSGSKVPLARKDWVLRILFGAVGGLGALGFFFGFPQLFLPLYDTLDYLDPTCTGCSHAVGECQTAWLFMGIYLGFLAYEVYRKDWVNVKLIMLVGGIAGGLWSALQVIQYMPALYPTDGFNWWRVWESSGGAAIGLAYGVAYYYCNRSLAPGDSNQRVQPYSKHPNAEKVLVYLALILGLGYAIINGTKGFNNIYFGNDDTLSQPTFIPVIVAGVALLVYVIHATRKTPLQVKDARDPIPRYMTLFYIVYFTQRGIGLLVTGAKAGDVWGPWASWPELAFFLYYLILMVFDIVILACWKAIRALEGAPELVRRPLTEDKNR